MGGFGNGWLLHLAPGRLPVKWKLTQAKLLSAYTVLCSLLFLSREMSLAERDPGYAPAAACGLTLGRFFCFCISSVPPPLVSLVFLRGMEFVSEMKYFIEANQ